MTNIVQRDLSYFSVILLMANIVIFMLFTSFFENRLQSRVVKPIQKLTKRIRNPKESFQEEIDEEPFQ